MKNKKFLKSAIFFVLLLVNYLTGLSQTDESVQIQTTDYAALTVRDVKDKRVFIEEKVNELLSKHFSDNRQKPDYSNTVYALDSIYDLLYQFPFTILSYLHPDVEIQISCQNEMLLIDSIENSIANNKTIYNKLVRLVNSKNYNSLTVAEKKYVNDRIFDYQLNGVNLEGQYFEEFNENVKKISSLSQAFRMNTFILKDSLWFTAPELEGLSPEFLKKCQQSDERYLIAGPGSDYDEILMYCKNPQTREKVYYSSLNYAFEKNQPLFKALIDSRHKMATLLGYNSYSDYKATSLMAGSYDTIMGFLNKLTPYIKTMSDGIVKDFQPYADSELQAWDLKFYEEIYKKDTYQLDNEQVEAYFPLESVLNGLFVVHQKIFGLTFIQVKDANAWHEDVLLYKVMKNNSPIGFIYFDLIEREGKPGQIAFTGDIMLPKSKGQRISQFVIGCSFSSKGATLLTLDHIASLFHEFGHVLQGIFCKNDLVLQNSRYLEGDFTETPSVAWEYVPWNVNVLIELSGHVETGEKISVNMAEKIIEIQQREQIFRIISLLYQSHLDQFVHNNFNTKDSTLFINQQKETWAKIYAVPFPEKTINPLTNSLLLAIDNYAAVYYGFLWSEIYAREIIAEFQKYGVLDEKIGERYRKEILSPGATYSGWQLMKNFLERDANEKSFLRAFNLN